MTRPEPERGQPPPKFSPEALQGRTHGSVIPTRFPQNLVEVHPAPNVHSSINQQVVMKLPAFMRFYHTEIQREQVATVVRHKGVEPPLTFAWVGYKFAEGQRQKADT